MHATNYDCKKLESITIPNSMTDIETGVFANCTSLSSVTIPESITSIGIHAFESCVSIKNIEIPSSVTSIGKGAFISCTGLESIDIPEKLTTIEESLFQNCSSLTSIVIPNTVTNLGNYTFLGCTSLSSVILGSNLQTIGLLAFTNCSALTTMVCQSPDVITCLTEYDANIFTDSRYKEGTLYVPTNLIEQYRTIDPWKYWGEIKSLEECEFLGIDAPALSNTDEQQIYSIDGRRLQTMQKGINIVGGRKIVVK